MKLFVLSSVNCRKSNKKLKFVGVMYFFEYLFLSFHRLE